MYVGDIVAGATVRGTFNTRDTDGAPITLAGTPALRVYKDDGTAEDDSGITLNVDFDSRTGLHLWEIDTSADGTFYAAGADYYVVITTGTVDSISVVGVCVGHFSIENRNDKAGSLGTQAKADVNAEADTAISDAALATAANLAVVDGIVDAILVDTAEIGAAGAGLTEAGGTGDHLTVLATAAALTTVDTVVDAIKAVTDNLPDAGALTSVATAANLATVDGVVDDILALLEDATVGLAALEALVDDLEGRLTAALSTQLAAHSLGVLRGVVDASATTTAVIFKSINGAAASATNDFYNGRHIVFTSGALAGQATSISDYDGATKTATVPALTGAPAEDVTFIVV